MRQRAYLEVGVKFGAVPSAARRWAEAPEHGRFQLGPRAQIVFDAVCQPVGDGRRLCIYVDVACPRATCVALPVGGEGRGGRAVE